MWDSNHIPAALIRTCHLDQLRRYSGLEKVTLQVDLGTSWDIAPGDAPGEFRGVFHMVMGIRTAISGDLWGLIWPSYKTNRTRVKNPDFAGIWRCSKPWKRRKCSHRGRGTLVVLALCCVSRVFGATLFTPAGHGWTNRCLSFPCWYSLKGNTTECLISRRSPDPVSRVIKHRP